MPADPTSDYFANFVMVNLPKPGEMPIIRTLDQQTKIFKFATLHERRRKMLKLGGEDMDNGTALYWEEVFEILTQMKEDFLLTPDQQRKTMPTKKKGVANPVGVSLPDPPIRLTNLKGESMKQLNHRFEAMLTQHFGFLVGLQQKNSGEIKLQVIDGKFVVMSYLRLGRLETRPDYVEEFCKSQFLEFRKRRSTDEAAGRPVDQSPGVAKKNRHTWWINIAERKEGMQLFKDVARAANTLGMGLALGLKMKLWFYDHGLPNTYAAGVLPPGQEQKHQGPWCMGHIMGPYHHGVPMPSERPSNMKFCEECHRHVKTVRHLCSACCKSIPGFRHDYCLSEQCPAKSQTEQGPDHGHGWRKEDAKAATWYDAKRQHLGRCPSEEEKWEYINKRFPNWYAKVVEHDEASVQGAKSITRSLQKPHVPYGGDNFVRAMPKDKITL